MRERPLSASSIKTYLQCVLKYYFQYEDKKPRIGKSSSLSYGTALHEALEELHTLVSAACRVPTPEDYDYVLNVFVKSAVREGLEDLSLLQQGKDLLIARLDNIDPADKVLGTEISFELKTPAGTPFKGSIDKLVELDSDTVAVIDYKSSKIGLTQEEADNDVQLSMYDLAVSILYPQYKTIVCALDYLRFGEVITHRTSEQRAGFVKFLDVIYQQINDTQPEAVQPTLNVFCGWCDFKGFCPEYQKLMNDPTLLLPPPSSLEDDEFIEHFERASAAKNTMEARLKEYKTEAYERLKGKETLKGKKFELYKTQGVMKSYNGRKVFEIVGQDDYLKLASVGTVTVDRYIRDNPKHAAALEEAANYNFMAPSFRTKKVKD